MTMELFEWFELIALITVLALLWDTQSGMREIAANLEAVAGRLNQLQRKN
jgi:hypothetical protein